MAKRRRIAGKLLPEGRSIVILRNTGQVITHATITEKAFRIETEDLGTLTLTVPQIQSIVYRNLPTYPTDVLRTIRGTELNGVVLNDPVHVRAEDLGGAATIARARIISIIF